MVNNKIEVALRACLQIAEKSPQPIAQLGQFFDAISSNSEWSSDEVMELQMLLIQRIVHRWRGPDSQ